MVGFQEVRRIPAKAGPDKGQRIQHLASGEGWPEKLSPDQSDAAGLAPACFRRHSIRGQAVQQSRTRCGAVVEASYPVNGAGRKPSRQRPPIHRHGAAAVLPAAGPSGGSVSGAGHRRGWRLKARALASSSCHPGPASAEPALMSGPYAEPT